MFPPVAPGSCWCNPINAPLTQIFRAIWSKSHFSSRGRDVLWMSGLGNLVKCCTSIREWYLELSDMFILRLAGVWATEGSKGPKTNNQKGGLALEGWGVIVPFGFFKFILSFICQFWSIYFHAMSICHAHYFVYYAMRKEPATYGLKVNHCCYQQIFLIITITKMSLLRFITTISLLNSKICKCLVSNKINVSNFHPSEVVGRGSEPQLQVGEYLMY